MREEKPLVELEREERMNGNRRPLRNVIPMVVESGPRSEHAFDIYSLLLRERVVFLGTPIDDHVANLIIGQLLYLDREDAGRDIQLYIHSPGGEVYSGLAIYDTMQLLRADVATHCVGLCASMATVLLAAGTKGKRSALPNATAHLHQAQSGVEGSAADIEIAARETLRNKQTIRELLAKHTGQPLERIARDSDRDFWLDAQGAKDYGLVDQILQRPPAA